MVWTIDLLCYKNVLPWSVWLFWLSQYDPAVCNREIDPNVQLARGRTKLTPVPTVNGPTGLSEFVVVFLSSPCFGNSFTYTSLTLAGTSPVSHHAGLLLTLPSLFLGFQFLFWFLWTTRTESMYCRFNFVIWCLVGQW